MRRETCVGGSHPDFDKKIEAGSSRVPRVEAYKREGRLFFFTPEERADASLLGTVGEGVREAASKTNEVTVTMIHGLPAAHGGTYFRAKNLREAKFVERSLNANGFVPNGPSNKP